MYKIEIKGIGVIMEELKQRINAKPYKIKRYNHRITQFWQNRLFDTSQRQFHSEHPIPDTTDVREFGATCGTSRWSTVGM